MSPDDWWQDVDRPAFRRAVLAWYRKHARDLPWRQTQDPYAVWVSEIMLQQTTVATVLGYYPKFLQLFPTIKALAQADEEEVLHAWQGLGYYRRARHLKRAAELLWTENAGQFPTDFDTIRLLPGLGRYTASAIACFALNQKQGILEANTRRLWARLTAAEGNPAKPPLETELWRLAENALPAKSHADFNQALMDLGSQVCTPRQPKCHACPVRSHCQAFALGRVDDYPQLDPRRAAVAVDHVTVITWNDARTSLFVTRRPDSGPWAGLWEFPRLERSPAEAWSEAARRALATFELPANLGPELFTQKHGIMHYKVTLKAFEAHLPKRSTRPFDSSSHRWVPLADLLTLPWSTPQRKIVRRLLERAATPSSLPASPTSRRRDR